MRPFTWSTLPASIENPADGPPRPLDQAAADGLPDHGFEAMLWASRAGLSSADRLDVLNCLLAAAR